MNTKDILLIGKGIIAGTYCSSFWKLSTKGKTGYNLDRDPTEDEVDKMMTDIQTHRASLFKELSELRKAERLLKRRKLCLKDLLTEAEKS